MKEDIEIKYQACNLVSAMVRNINDNFKNISFDFINDEILVQIILIDKTPVEEGYINDMIAEFAALQISDCVKRPQVFVGLNHLPLKNVVYELS